LVTVSFHGKYYYSTIVSWSEIALSVPFAGIAFMAATEARKVVTGTEPPLTFA